MCYLFVLNGDMCCQIDYQELVVDFSCVNGPNFFRYQYEITYFSAMESYKVNFSEVSYFTSQESIFILLKLENAATREHKLVFKWLNY